MANAKTLNHDKMVKLTTAGILTAIVVVFQMIGASIRLGIFSVSFVLVPIVIGAALCGPIAGAWLGFVFSVTVLLSGDAALFLAFNVPATIIVVLLKGTLCGLIAGLVFNLLKKANTYLSVIVTALVCPIVNTGIFFLGCRFIFFESIREWAANNPDIPVKDPLLVILTVFIGFNFFFELGVNVILAPAIVRIVNAISHKNNK